jgi:hypothetical protein
LEEAFTSGRTAAGARRSSMGILLVYPQPG